MGYATLWADDSTFGPGLYLHDAGAIQEPHGTSNAHLLGASWERLRVDGRVGEYFVRLCPAFSANHEAARILEDEIERRGLQARYIVALADLIPHYAAYIKNYSSILYPQMTLWALIRATPEQKAQAFLAAVGAS